MSARGGNRNDAARDTPTIQRSEQSRSATASGTLVLIGGALRTTGEAFESFMHLADARGNGSVVGITAASGVPLEAAALWEEDFAEAGAKTFCVPQITRGDARADRELAARIADANAVFLGGGDQVKLVATLAGTESERQIRALFQRGGVVCGTSAGAAACTELTMAGGEMDEEGNNVQQYIGPGLGLLGYNCIIDTHFSQRRRLQRLFVVIGSYPELMGLGIDEDTALVVHGAVGEVCGAGGVTFIDGRDTVRFDNADDLEFGRQLTLSHLRLGVVGTRYHLNLESRELDELVRHEPSPHLRKQGGAHVAARDR
ncbi:MAG: cyanophycinase [Gemmatimonadetes bacterium]|nr:cyanophycinase [Gemmatimonadota bacterium]